MEIKENIINEISKEQNITPERIKAVLDFLEDGKTVAFIARYRKEVTGGLDEEAIRVIYDAYTYQVSLSQRKEDVKRLINEKGLLTDELKDKIDAATKLVEVEDLYMPFKEKKKTKATEAINFGLSPLADIMMENRTEGNKEEIVNQFLNENVKTYDDAITGAKYIVAERISDSADIRGFVRDLYFKEAIISTKKKDNDNDLEEKYKLYYESSDSVAKIKPHRILAINRAEKEDVISVSISVIDEKVFSHIDSVITNDIESIFKTELKEAIRDSYKRLIQPSIIREVRNNLTEVAEEQAIKIFALNLKALLMESPIKGKTVLGVDPAFRTGCKFAVVSPSSNVLDLGVIYPNEKKKDQEADPELIEQSKKTIVDLVKKYNVDIITIGNGTASRETESFIAEVINENNLSCKYVIVSEAGASIYSASEVGIEEFPELPVEKRSAISIARRIQDPLAELVKIEPKNIGVGQYQHDVTPKKLSTSLDNVVMDCVNHVGVNLNTASVSLLKYVSGLSKATAKNIVKYREEHQRFNSREELKKVAKLGDKTYEQCVGFTRIIDGENPLDKTSIHPESYEKTKSLLDKLGISLDELGSQKANDIINSIENKEELAKSVDMDLYTFNDILDAIKAPTRDIRESYPGPKLRSDVMHFEDLKVGMELDGVVRNVVDFGCFVDCYVKYDGLLHVSNMSVNKINHPTDMLSIGDNVHVYVIGIDYDKHKYELSLLNPNSFKDFKTIEVGQTLEGKITSVEQYIIKADFGYRFAGIITKDNASIYDINLVDNFQVGSSIKAKVINVEYDTHRLELTLLNNTRMTIKDLKIDEAIEGYVHSIAEYGIFIDLGIKKDAFCHVSNISLKHVTPNEFVKLGDKVVAYPIKIDVVNNKIDVSLIAPNDRITKSKFEVGKSYKGVVKSVYDYGCFIDLGIKENLFVHVSNFDKFMVSDAKAFVNVGDEKEVYIITNDEKSFDGSFINPKDSLSIKDLKVNEKYQGIVYKIQDYGCFIDLGVKKNGFLHVSEMSGKTINVGDKLDFYITSIDLGKDRIELSFKNPLTALKYEDFKVGNEYDGIVKSVTNFGCFVDLGDHIDGLVHISNMSLNKVNDPNEIVKVQDKVHVYVIANDPKQKKLQLSFINPKTVMKLTDIKSGMELKGKVRKITTYGAFVDLENTKGVSGLVHKSRISKERIENVSDVLTEGQEVDVYVIGVDYKESKIELTMLKPTVDFLIEDEEED